MFVMQDINFNSVEMLPGFGAKAVFSVKEPVVFREDTDIAPAHVGDDAYMPWGGDNLMPFDLLDLIEVDETLSTCQIVNAESCYGAGLGFDTCRARQAVVDEIEDFSLDNDMPEYFLGACQDFKHFGFVVTLFVLNNARDKIVNVMRKEACYCRFAPVDDATGRIPYILYGNWRKGVSPESVEKIMLLDRRSPWRDLQAKAQKNKTVFKYALVSRVPTPDSTYYPIPHYAALFRGKWYAIKQLIGSAKKAKLENSAPIKYHIEVAHKYWDTIFRAEGITDRRKQQLRVVQEKQSILDFLTGAENSGKAWFSTFYTTPDGKEQHDVVINKVSTEKEGGDWESDIQEAINMICFTMRVHSNLVGSVPGKSQSNNSGSDKRELYTIAQATQKPYRDLLFKPLNMLVRFNGWKNVKPVVPFVQLTTLDEHKDAKLVDQNEKGNNE